MWFGNACDSSLVYEWYKNSTLHVHAMVKIKVSIVQIEIIKHENYGLNLLYFNIFVVPTINGEEARG